MSIAKIQRGDKVKVISGAFKGVTGPITKVVTTKKGFFSSEIKGSEADSK